jgi:hypothetical protein
MDVGLGKMLSSIGDRPLIAFAACFDLRSCRKSGCRVFIACLKILVLCAR